MARAGAGRRRLHPGLLAQVLEPHPPPPRQPVARRGARGAAGLRAARSDACPAPSRSPTPWNSKSRTRSNSPARSRGAIRSGSSSARVSSTPGWEARKPAIACGIRVAPGGGEGGHAQPPAAPGGDRRDLGLGCLHPGQDPVGVAGEGGARRGRPNAAAVALDQRRPDFALERRDRLRDRRLRVGEGVGGGGEGAVGDDLAEDHESSRVQHKQSLFKR